MDTGIWLGFHEPGLSITLEFRSWLWALNSERGCFGLVVLAPGTWSRSQEPSPKPVLSNGTDTVVVRAAQGRGRPHKWGVEETASEAETNRAPCASGTGWEAWAGPGSLPSPRQASGRREADS